MIGLIISVATRLIPWLATTLTAVHSAWILAGVGIVVLFLDQILLLLAHLGVLLMRVLISIIFRILSFIITALPDMPDDWPDIAWEGIIALGGMLNRYIPLDTVLLYLGLLFLVQGMVMAYKAMKFLRGGG